MHIVSDACDSRTAVTTYRRYTKVRRAAGPRYRMLGITAYDPDTATA